MFNEQEWINLIFLLSDTQEWIDDMTKEMFGRLPCPGKKKFMRKNYYLSVTALAHIIERHYYKINRHPHTGKFTISFTEILHHIKEAGAIPPMPLSGSLNYYRVYQSETLVGHDKSGTITNLLTILTDGGGKIITAFPGSIIPLWRACPAKAGGYE